MIKFKSEQSIAGGFCLPKHISYKNVNKNNNIPHQLNSIEGHSQQAMIALQEMAVFDSLYCSLVAKLI